MKLSAAELLFINRRGSKGLNRLNKGILNNYKNLILYNKFYGFIYLGTTLLLTLFKPLLSSAVNFILQVTSLKYFPFSSPSPIHRPTYPYNESSA
jgi:hypothetical protein